MIRARLRDLVRSVAMRVLRVRAVYSADTIKTLVAGNVVVAANHVSLLDGLVVALASPVPLVFGVDPAFSVRTKSTSMAMRALCALGFGYVVPIDSQSRYGIRTLLRSLERGQSVMIFPEGRISQSGHPQPYQPGLAWLLKKSGAALLPVHISGAEKSRFFAKSGNEMWPEIAIDFEPVQ